jgi:hypothetical protein
MSTTRISDTIVPEVFNSYMSKNTVQKMAFYGAGVLRSDEDLASKLAGGGRTFNVPFWKDLDDEESDPGSDDPDSHAIPGTIGTGKDVAVRQFRTRGWSTANLTAELAGADPMQRISSRVSDYWARQFDDIAIATARGVFADNAANDSGDMIHDISTDAVGAPAAAELFSAEAVSAAAQTMGDQKQKLNLIVMHSVVQTRLTDLDLIDFRPDSEGKMWHEYYRGFRVLVSDKVPAIAGTNRVRYHSYLFGGEVFGWATHDPEKPVEVESDPSAGDGAGVETLWTRRQFAIHPYGIKWTDNTVSGIFPTNAELALAANWDRVYPERKQIPMALLITNG